MLVRRVTNAICRPNAANQLRTVCEAFVDALLPVRHIAGAPESPLCGSLRPGVATRSVQHRAPGGAYCWPTCADFQNYADALTAHAGCLGFMTSACAAASVDGARKACVAPYPPPAPLASPPPPETPFEGALDRVGFAWAGTGRCVVRNLNSPPPPPFLPLFAPVVQPPMPVEVPPPPLPPPTPWGLDPTFVLTTRLHGVLNSELAQASPDALAAMCAEECARRAQAGPGTCVAFAARLQTATGGNVAPVGGTALAPDDAGFPEADCELYAVPLWDGTDATRAQARDGMLCELWNQAAPDAFGRPGADAWNYFASSRRPPAPPPPPLGRILEGDVDCPLLESAAACRNLVWAHMRLEVTEVHHVCREADLSCFVGAPCRATPLYTFSSFMPCTHNRQL